jgi:hypothetical protein
MRFRLIASSRILAAHLLGSCDSVSGFRPVQCFWKRWHHHDPFPLTWRTTEGIRHAQQTRCFKSTLDEARSARQAAGHADARPLQSGGQSKPCWLSGPGTSTAQGSKAAAAYRCDAKIQGATAEAAEALTSPSTCEFLKEAGSSRLLHVSLTYCCGAVPGLFGLAGGGLVFPVRAASASL